MRLWNNLSWFCAWDNFGICGSLSLSIHMGNPQKPTVFLIFFLIQSLISSSGASRARFLILDTLSETYRFLTAALYTKSLVSSPSRFLILPPALSETCNFLDASLYTISLISSPGASRARLLILVTALETYHVLDTSLL